MPGALGQNQYGNNGSRAAGAVNPRFKYNVGDIIKSSKKPPGNWVLANGATVNAASYPYLANVFGKVGTNIGIAGGGRLSTVPKTHLGSFAFGNGVYVIAGYTQNSLYGQVICYNAASDIATVVPVVANTNAQTVVFYNGYFYLAMSNNAIYCSTNGTNWTQSGLSNYGATMSIINGNFIGYGVSGNSVVAFAAGVTPTSNAGTNTVSNIGTNLATGAPTIAYGNSLYVIVGDASAGNNIMYSSNPNFTGYSITAYAGVGILLGIIFVNGFFYVFGTGGIAKSSDLSSWIIIYNLSAVTQIVSQGTSNPIAAGAGNAQISGLVYINGTFYAALSFKRSSDGFDCNCYLISTDGVTWSNSVVYQASGSWYVSPSYAGIFIEPVSNTILLGSGGNSGGGPALFIASLGSITLPNSGGAGYYVSASPNQFA